MIELDTLTVQYDNKKALDSVSFSIPEGSFTTVVGPSGCGKSTLLLACAGLIKPTTGSIRIMGKTVTEVRESTAILFQDVGLFPWKTVIDNLSFILEDRGCSKEAAHTRALAALAAVEMDAYANRFIETLSGGQKQRVGFAKALVMDADVMLLDEATSALDNFTSEAVQDVLKTLHRARMLTVIYVTHKIDEAVYLGDQVLVMRDGALVECVNTASYQNRDTTDFFTMCVSIKEALKQ